ncbi:hypothetical protein PG997_009982 [Apiospora hydei]|uniref:Uncharacterized protein n=1 Tax=Apiospora hydei TaxID=1337664 RepID=A0ABR1VZG8_9PEZI
MLGEPDYWAPLMVKSHNTDGEVVRAKYTYQHPRYTIHTRQQPCSVWFAYDLPTSTTTYIVTYGKGEEWVDKAKDRLTHYFVRTGHGPGLKTAEGHDPFLVQSILCHESLSGAKTPITQLRHMLYDVLDTVSEYSKEPFHRSSLKAMTEQLHKVSQDADSLLASAEMGSMVASHCKWSRASLQTEVRTVQSISPFAASNVGDALEYLVQSLEAQKRWLSSYQSRKDIAMNLVFNLVTQKDSETSTDIARDTKADSASMKTIAALTMIFLPATAVSGFFGMAFFNVTDGGVFVSSTLVWLFVVTTVPLTAFIFLAWAFWESLIGWLLKAKTLMMGRKTPPT